MPQHYKTLGQAKPAAAANGDLYTVPGATEAVVSSITVSEVAGAATTFRIYVRPNAAAAADGNAFAKDVDLAAKEVLVFTVGITLDAADVITVQSASGGVTFQAFGTEVS